MSSRQQYMPQRPRMTSSRSTSTGMSSTPIRSRSRSRQRYQQHHAQSNDNTPLPSPSRYQRPDDHYLTPSSSPSPSPLASPSHSKYSHGHTYTHLNHTQPRSPPHTPTLSTTLDPPGVNYTSSPSRSASIDIGGNAGGGVSKLQQQRQQQQLLFQQRQQLKMKQQSNPNPHHPTSNPVNSNLNTSNYLGQTIEDEYNIKIMKERQDEMLQINQKMNTVNAIYKDLAGMIDDQQDLIDRIDEQIDLATENTRKGEDNYKEARMRVENPILEDLFGDKLGVKSEKGRDRKGMENTKTRRRVNGDRKQRRRSKSRNAARNKDRITDCVGPMEVMPEQYQDVIKAGLNDMRQLGHQIIGACTMPQPEDVGEYTYKREREKPNPRPANSYAYRSEQLSQAQW